MSTLEVRDYAMEQVEIQKLAMVHCIMSAWTSWSECKFQKEASSKRRRCFQYLQRWRNVGASSFFRRTITMCCIVGGAMVVLKLVLLLVRTSAVATVVVVVTPALTTLEIRIECSTGGAYDVVQVETSDTCPRTSTLQ